MSPISLSWRLKVFHRSSLIERAIATGDWLEQMCCLWNVGNRFVDRVISF